MKKIIILLFIITAYVYPQSFDGISPGLAGNYMTMSRGVNALGWNPANLALSRGNGIEISLLSFNSSLYNNSFSLDTYNRFFTEEGHGGYWNTKDKNELLDIMSDNGLRMDVGVNANILGLAFNNFGMAVQMIGQGYTKLAANKEPFEMVLFGETIDRSYQYEQSSQVKAAAYSAMKISFGYAYPINMKWLRPELKDLAIGLTWNRYVGFAVAQSRKADVLFERIPGDEESLKYALLMEARTANASGSSSGTGNGFDFGLSSGWGKNIDFSWSFTNVGASIKWVGDTEKHYLYHADSVAIEDIDKDDDESSKTEIDTTYDIGSFRTSLPAMMRMGAVYHLSQQWKVSAEYHQGLNRAFGNSVRMRLGAATEYKALPWLPLRGGLAFGGIEGSQLGMGFGLHFPFFQFDYSFAMKGGLWPTYAKGLFNAVSMKLVF